MKGRDELVNAFVDHLGDCDAERLADIVETWRRQQRRRADEQRHARNKERAARRNRPITYLPEQP